MTARRFLPLILAAGLAIGAFEALAADFVIDTPVTTTNGGNTLADGYTLTINASGAITISGDLSDGIDAARGNTITNNGAITTSGSFSDAIGARTGNTITNTGTITTSGRGSEGISAGTGNTITNNKSITTSGDFSEGIEISSRNTITNNGSITTSGSRSEGIEAETGNTITNNKSITTSRDFSEGIEVSSQNIITNNGSITTSGSRAEGIDAGTENTVINTGTITTSGNFSEGIDGFRDNPLLANDGIILTRGDFAHGIRARTNNTVRNSQTITTRGRQAYGIKAGEEGDRDVGLRNNNRVSNSGTITTRGPEAAGIWMSNSNTLTHSGMIHTFGLNAPGIQAANGNTLTLNGGIKTAGNGAHGVLTGTGTTLKPIGPKSRIQTMAADADGLRIGGLAASQTILTHRGHIEAGDTGIRLPYVQMFDNSGHILGMNGAGLHFTMVTGPMTLTNTGTIAGQTGIRIDRTGTGANVMIDNAGTLRSLQGAAGTALDFRGQGQDTLHLRAGSTLEGQIRWDGEGDLLRLEALGPTQLTLIDNDAPANTQPTRFKVKTPTGLPVLRSTMTSNTVGEAQTTLTLLNPTRTDPRTEATQSLWTGALFQSLAQQQRVQQTFQSGANRRSAHTAPRSALWIRPFGGLQNYKREDETPAARYRYGGALAGYGMATSAWQAGAFLGAARSELMGRGQGIELEGRAVFLGAYGQTLWQALEVSVAVLFGKSRHDTAWLWRDNRVSGGLARREYAGKHDFISPELGLSTRLNMQGLTLIPELKLRYLGLFNAEARARQADGLSFKPEDRHIGLIRASVGLPLSFPENQYGGRLSGQLRLGAEGRGRLGGESIEVRSGNDTVRYRVGSDNAIMGFVGAGFEYGVSAMNLSFSADLEAGYDSEAALGVRGQLGFVWGF